MHVVNKQEDLQSRHPAHVEINAEDVVRVTQIRPLDEDWFRAETKLCKTTTAVA